MKKEIIGIPYQSNPAIIKSYLSRLSKNELITQAKFIKKMAIELPFGNRRRMYVELYKWCRSHYLKTFR